MILALHSYSSLNINKMYKLSNYFFACIKKGVDLCTLLFICPT